MGLSRKGKGVVRGAARYNTKFNKTWSKQYECIQAVQNNPYAFLCTVCNKKLSCKHQGEADVTRHIACASHNAFVQQMSSQQRLTFPSSSSPIATKIKRAEVKMSILLAQHNVPLALADHLSPIIRDLFDGDVAKGYACARTKTTAILNNAVAPAFKAELVSAMLDGSFSILIDGSNDAGLQKMNPITVKIFDASRGKVESQFFDMCTTTGPSGATAESIFAKMDSVLSLHRVPWGNCVGFGVDNASVNMGRHNSIKSRVEQVNDNVYFMGCPCHIAHNTAGVASEKFVQVTGFDVEEMAIDLFYWFDKSSKRKAILNDYCTFCDVTYREIVKHVSTRWLSLSTAVERTIKLYDSLRSYFLSEDDRQARFRRLSSLFEKPLTEVYLYFYQSSLSVFTEFNLFLQREDPCIHLVRDKCMSLLKKCLGRFVLISVIRNADGLTKVDYQNRANQVSDRNLFIGFVLDRN